RAAPACPRPDAGIVGAEASSRLSLRIAPRPAAWSCALHAEILSRQGPHTKIVYRAKDFVAAAQVCALGSPCFSSVRALFAISALSGRGRCQRPQKLDRSSVP